MRYKIIEQINKSKTGISIRDLLKLGFKLNTVRSIVNQLEKEKVIRYKKIGPTKIYFLADEQKSELLISLIKKSKYYNLPLDLLFKIKYLILKYYMSTVVTKLDVESILDLTNASVLIKTLDKHNLLRIMKKRPLEFCFKQNEALELFLRYFGKSVSKRIRYDYNEINTKYMSPSDIQYLESLKSGLAKSILLHNSRSTALDRFLGFFIYHSCAIEGNKISLRDTPQILKEGRIPINVDEKDYIDYINSRDVIKKVLIDNDFNRDINHELIKSINHKLLDRLHVMAGEYRSKGHDLRPFGAGFKSSPGEYVKIDLDILIKLYYSLKKEGVHPLIIATVFHHKFEKIHPFYEGNGRTGRILLNYILMRSGFPPLVVEKKNKKRYYSALSFADNQSKELQDASFEAYKLLFKYLMKQLDSTFYATIKS